MRHRFLGTRGALIVLFLATVPTLAMAYIDPGNGAYMVQALFTLIGAALFYIRHPIRTAKLLWNRLTRREKPESVPEPGTAAGSTTVEPRADFSPAVRQELTEGSAIGVATEPER